MAASLQTKSSPVAPQVNAGIEHSEISYGEALNQGLRQAMS
ncbi:MAG: hypothetical protein ABI619_11280 [Betaproteobacteria bacterium]